MQYDKKFPFASSKLKVLCLIILQFYLSEFKQMKIQSIDLLHLTENYGTPLYVYDAEAMQNNYNRFINAFDVHSMKVHYACKALSNISILKLFKRFGAGLDCVSIQELQLGLKAGYAAQDILFTPNNISEEEYDAAVAFGVKINIDNFEMLEHFGEVYPEVPVCIRINPHVMGGGNRKISVGHIGSKFGISIHQLPLLERIVKGYKINVEGIHVHTGSDILDSDIFIKAARVILDVVDRLIL
jgi:diaminopimelate decarboxylase